MIKKLIVNGKTIEYDLLRKKVKNINLRVRTDGSVTVSAGNRVPEARIEDFVRANAEAVLRAIERYKVIAESSIEDLEYVDGETVRLLGERLPLRITEDKKARAEQSEDCITLSVPDTNDREEKVRALEILMREICRKATLEVFEAIYPTFEKLGVPRPIVKFRKMTRKWGVCRPERKEITFSYMLAEVSPSCIEYIVMHELVHLIHPDHSSRFYAKLTELMPDWRARKSELERIVKE